MPSIRQLLAKDAPKLVQAVDKFVGRRLPSSPSVPTDSKHINDPVWKTIHLKRWEAALIDVPLFQRLRRIRQLGVAELVFPGAGYSRFEHSVGTLQSMELLCRALLSLEPTPLISPDDHNLLRLAALLHDIGHCAYSHVSENFYRTLPVGPKGTLDELRLTFEAHLGHRPSPSEIMSAAIISSEPFQAFIKALNIKVERPEAEICEWISTILLGGFPDPHRPFLTQLLTGPFDADKLDYMQRDCLMAGIPLPVDIPRLIEKLRSVDVRVSHLSLSMQKRFKLSPESTVSVLGVGLSGSRAIEEMLIARVILFDKLYFHFKIQAAEVLVRRALGRLRNSGALATMADFLSTDDVSIGLFADPSFAVKNVDSKTRQLLTNLRNRVLPRRAFCFASAFRISEEDPTSLKWTRLVDMTSNESERSTTEEAVRKLAVRLARHRGLSSPSVGDVFISYSPPSRVHTSVETFLVTHENDVVPFRNAGDADAMEGRPLFRNHFDVDRWADAYETNKAFGYVFSSGPERAAVYVAAEIVFGQTYEVRFSDAGAQVCKIGKDQLHEYRVAAEELGLLRLLPVFRPLQERLQKSDAKSIALATAAKLKDFEGLDGIRIDDTRVQKWLNQFPVNHLDDALKFAGSLTIPTRTDFVESIRAALKQYPATFVHSTWVPLGSPTDSAATWAYYLKDIDDTVSLRTLNIDQAVGAKGQSLVLFDDCISSGAQVKDILSTWLGAPTALGEPHGNPLSDSKALRDRELNFFFLYGRPQAEATLRKICEELGLKVTNIFVARPLPADGLEAIGFGKDHSFTKVLRNIGTNLIRATKTGAKWTKARVAESSLGYANAAQLVILPKNVPVFTVTAVWSSGSHEGRAWMPLAPRRAK